jgi:hypothetical protein
MTFDNRFAVWIQAADLPVYRTVGGPKRVTIKRPDGDIVIEGPEQVTWLTQFRPWNGFDYTDREFTLDIFRAVDEGYALDVMCPCGELLSGDDVGHLLRLINDHCHKAKHPMTKVESWGW